MLAVSSAMQAFINLVMGEVGLALLIGGGVGLLILWYLKGRDQPQGLVAEYLREPPDDLHPGLVGTLLDEHANSHDVVATLINLGQRGIVQFLAPTPERPEYQLVLLRNDLPLSLVEQRLLQLFFGTLAAPNPGPVPLSKVRAQFMAAIPTFKVALYEEVVSAGFFVASPRETRRRYRIWATVLMVLSPLIGLPLALLVPELRLILMPTVALFIVGVAFYRLAKAMPVKTKAGAEAAARWQAFRRYLAQLDRYERVEAARGIFEQYLPYAIAFGLEKTWVQRWTTAQQAPPTWLDTSADPFIPVLHTNVGDAAFGATAADLDLGGVGEGLGQLAGNLPTLSGDSAGAALEIASEAGGAALEGASDLLGGLLDAASSLFDW